MSENTFYTWKCKVAGIEPDHIRKRKDHHSENQVLKQIVVGQARLIEARVKVYQKTATGRVQGARFLISTLRIETQGMSVRGYTNWGQTTMAKRLDRIVSFDTAAGRLTCRSVFQSVGCPAENRPFQKRHQSGPPTRSTWPQSTHRSFNKENRKLDGASGLTSGGRPVVFVILVP